MTNSQIESVNVNVNDEYLNQMFPIQEALELSSREEGILKMKDRTLKSVQKGNESNTEYGQTLLVHSLHKFALGIQNWLDEDKHKGGHKAKVKNTIRDADPYTIAFIFLKTILNSVSSKNLTFTNILNKTGKAIEWEMKLVDLHKQNPELCKRLLDASNKRAGWRKLDVIERGIATEAAAGNIERWKEWAPSKADNEEDNWDLNKHLNVGKALLKILIEEVGIVEPYKVLKKNKKRMQPNWMLRPTEETQAWIESRKELSGLTSPFYKPLVVPPRPWTMDNLTNGIYYTLNQRPVPFVKNPSKQYAEELKSADMPIILHSVNEMMKTKWQVNHRMLDFIEELWQVDASWCDSIPAKYVQPMPEQQDVRLMDVHEKAVYWDDRNQILISNREDESKRAAFCSMLNVAREFSQYDHFYLGYNLDFRNRVYCCTGPLNGMGPDETKALLQFADGKPLGKSGARYLAIHIANLGDFDKVSKKTLDERVAWVYDNEAFIRSVADNPWEDRRWADADKPLQFVAACHDWVGYLENGTEHVSHTICSLDGSSSGLQHLSMATRCKSTAEKVNVLPSDEPADMYKLVADKVVEVLRADAQKPEEDWPVVYNNMGVKTPSYGTLAKEWLLVGFGRKEAKRACMTYSYGSAMFGFRDQINDDFMKPLRRKCSREGLEFPFSYDKGFKACNYIAKLLYDAIVDTVKRPAVLMKWLSKSASLVAKSEHTLLDGQQATLGVRWTTPLGFPVVLTYHDKKKSQVRSYLHGETFYHDIHKPQKKINAKKTAQTMSPNWVHSLDASHLHLSVSRMAEETDGQTSFSMIHDSFGCHAADLELFSNQIKLSLVELYDSEDVVEALYNELKAQLNSGDVAKLERPPELGTLDYSLVILSQYSFA